MMYIYLEQIKTDGIDLRFEETPQEFPVLAEMINQGECEFIAPINTSLRALRFTDRVEVEGDVQTAVRLDCGRCLKAFETSLESHFALTYTTRIEEVEMLTEQDEVELRPEQISRIYFEGEKIDLQAAIQEQVVMAFPIRALCSENCRGLCPQCGADQNDGSCSCYRQAIDSKFIALKNFRPRKT